MRYEDGTADTIFYLARRRRTDRSESGAYRPSSGRIRVFESLGYGSFLPDRNDRQACGADARSIRHAEFFGRPHQLYPARRAVPTVEGALRAPRGDDPNRVANVVGKNRALYGEALSIGRNALFAAADLQAASANH